MLGTAEEFSITHVNYLVLQYAKLTVAKTNMGTDGFILFILLQINIKLIKEIRKYSKWKIIELNLTFMWKYFCQHSGWNSVCGVMPHKADDVTSCWNKTSTPHQRSCSSHGILYFMGKPLDQGELYNSSKSWPPLKKYPSNSNFQKWKIPISSYGLQRLSYYERDLTGALISLMMN